MMKINLLKKISDNVMYKDSIKVVILRLCGALLLFTVTLYITNNFDAELVGQYDLSRSILFIFGSFCLLGLNQSIIYYSGVFKARNTMSALKDLYKKMITVIIVLGLFFLLGFFLFPKENKSF